MKWFKRADKKADEVLDKVEKSSYSILFLTAFWLSGYLVGMFGIDVAVVVTELFWWVG